MIYGEGSHGGLNGNRVPFNQSRRDTSLFFMVCAIAACRANCQSVLRFHWVDLIIVQFGHLRDGAQKCVDFLRCVVVTCRDSHAVANAQ